MICKSELSADAMRKALETVAAWCYFNRCDACPLYQKEYGRPEPCCVLLTHIPSEYKSLWIDGVAEI